MCRTVPAVASSVEAEAGVRMEPMAGWRPSRNSRLAVAFGTGFVIQSYNTSVNSSSAAVAVGWQSGNMGGSTAATAVVAGIRK